MKTVLIFCFVICCFTCDAQKRRQNVVYAELLGNGFLGSVNFEKSLPLKPYFAIRCGIGMYGLKNKAVTVPVSLHYLLKTNPGEYWDFGAGITYSGVSVVELYSFIETRNPPSNKYSISFIPSVGYRNHISKKIMWRISVMPVITKAELLPFAGISFGKLL